MGFNVAPDLQPIVDEFITPGLHAEIQEEVRQAVDEAVTRAVEDIKKRLARRIPKMFASIAIKLSTMLAVETVGREIRISIKMPDKEDKS